MSTLDLEPIRRRFTDALDAKPPKGEWVPLGIQRLCDSVSDIKPLISEVEHLRSQIDAVKKLHRPAHAVFSWNGGTRYEDPCPECHGAPGVHPCGCWADTQLEYACAECHRLGVLSKGVYDYTYPCPTIRALEAA